MSQVDQCVAFQRFKRNDDLDILKRSEYILRRVF